MNRNRLIFAVLILMGMMGISVIAQTRPLTTTPKPGATPTPRPAATPTPKPAATPAPRPGATPTPRPAATPVVGNAAVPDSRIALIDTGMFGDEKNGIFLYVDAAKKVQLEFQARTTELQSLDDRLTALANEIKTLMQAKVVDQKTIQAKQSEGERLQQEMTTKKGRLDEDVSKRYQEVISPISNQIGAAMDLFARQRGITMTLDISKLLPAILTAVPATDLTKVFIDDFNRSHPRTGPASRP
jgi:Skp family chaperone for outer membrane proteins